MSAPRRGVVTVVLAAFAIRDHELRRHHPHAVSQGAELPSPLMGSVLTPHRPLQHVPAGAIHAVQRAFAKWIPMVVTSLMGLPLSGRLNMPKHVNRGTSTPSRVGEVPYIR